MNRTMLYLTMASIFLLLSFSIVSTTRKHMLVMDKAGEMHEHIVYLTDSVQYSNPDTIFEHIHDTVVLPEIKVEKVYVIDTIKIQDTLYLQ